MDPFKIRVDWLCHSAYGDPVVVELHTMGAEPVVLRKFPSVPRAIDWSLVYLSSRGFDYWCNVDLHQRLDHTHITLHPRPWTRTAPTGDMAAGAALQDRIDASEGSR